MSGGIIALYCNDDFTKLASLAIKKAFDYAGASGHTYIGSEHLLYGISTEGTAGVILRSSGVTDERIKKLFPDAKIIFINEEQNDIINRPGPRVYKSVEFFSDL